MVRQAIRATTAAPTFFPPLMINGALYSDGALLCNNPSAVAFHEAKVIKTPKVQNYNATYYFYLSWGKARNRTALLLYFLGYDDTMIGFVFLLGVD